MTSAVWGFLGAVIVAVLGLVGQIVVGRSNKNAMLSELRHQSEVADQNLNSKIEKMQAVTDTKIDELTREVRDHNNFARRVPVIEAEIENLKSRIG